MNAVIDKQQAHENPIDAEFKEVLRGPRIIKESRGRSGKLNMLLPLETMDVIIDVIMDIAFKRRKRREPEGMRFRLKIQLDSSQIWRSYFEALCEYADFFTDIAKKQRLSAGVRADIRERATQLGVFLANESVDLENEEREILATVGAEDMQKYLEIIKQMNSATEIFRACIVRVTQNLI